MIFLFIGVLAAATPQQGEHARIQRMAELIVSAFNNKEYDVILAQLNAGAKAQVSAQELKSFYDRLRTSSGKITSLGKPAFFDEAVAIYPAELERAKMDFSIALDSAGKVRGLEITPRKSTSSRSKTKLMLPFGGEWLVEWGGDTPEQNYHQSIAIVRFAFDFMKVDARGKKYTRDGKKNEDYYSFGQQIVSPADGVVTDVISGVRDNVPGDVNNFADIGNMVMVRHANGEVSVFAHLKAGSSVVTVGQSVKRGQLIGLCGNSGNSIEPHLHYQLQETPIPTRDGTIKVFFENITVKRGGKAELKAEFSPVKGDVITAGGRR